MIAREDHVASAFCGKEELGAAVRKMTPNVQFAFAVIVRRVDEIDPGIQHGIQDLLCLTVAAGPSVPNTFSPHFHGTVPQHGDFKSRPS
jgi:hypothetical protein